MFLAIPKSHTCLYYDNVIFFFTRASLRDDYDEESFNGKKSIIYKPSSKKHRPSIRVIQNVSPTSTLTLPLKPRNPTQNNNRVSIAYNADSEQCSVIRNDKPLPPRPSVSIYTTVLSLFQIVRQITGKYVSAL